MIATLVFLAAVASYAGFAWSYYRRRRAECAANGHAWEKAVMGDHPSVNYIYTHCGEEV